MIRLLIKRKHVSVRAIKCDCSTIYYLHRSASEQSRKNLLLQLNHHLYVHSMDEAMFDSLIYPICEVCGEII